MAVLAQLGDVNPVDHGGYWVLDTEEAEMLLIPSDITWESSPPFGENEDDDEDDEEEPTSSIYRISLDKCTFINGVLSDNKFHPDHPAWFAKNIQSVMDFADNPDLITQLCSDDLIQRAIAYRDIANYHGWENFDSYPLELTYDECVERYNEERFQTPG